MSGCSADRIRVLHVDDDPNIGGLAATFLERIDDRITVETATSAREGLDRLTDDVDCVVSDYDMPGRDGIDFLDAVREEYPDLPFVLFTGEGSESVASEAIAHGVTDYLQKGTGREQYELLANRVANAVEQYRANRRVAALERVRRVLRETTQALVQAETAEEIERRVCETISEADPYRFAWIGDHDAESQTVRPRVGAGVAEGYLETIEVTTDESETGQGPTGRAVRTREMAVMQDIPGTDGYEPWREDALERGYRSSAAVPLVYDGTLYGVLNVYADRVQAFDERERKLLDELGDDIAHALSHAEARARRNRYERIVDHLPVGVYRTTPGPDGELVDVNDTLVDIFDAESEAEMLGRPVADLYADPDDRAALSRKLETDGRIEDEQLRQETLDGEEIWIEVTAVTTEENGETYFDGIVREVTERKRRERRLRLFREAVESSGHSIYFTDTDGTITYVNPAFEEATGYSADEAVGENPSILQSGEHDEAFYEEMWETILAGEVWRNELVNATRAGDRYVVDQTIAPVENDAGEIERFVAVNADVTEQKERERELARERERWAALFENSPDAIAIHDATGDIVETNRRNVENLGYSREELLSMNVADYEVGHTREQLREVWAGMEVGERRQVEGKHRRKDGSTYPVEVWVTKLELDGEERFLALGRDITERREYERTLRRKRELIEQGMNAVDDLFYVASPDGQLERVNERTSDVTGYPDDELPGMDVTDLFPPDERDRVEAKLRETVETGGATLRADVVTSDGGTVPHEFRKRRLTDADGSVVGVVGIGRDVSERIQRERELREQNERLEEFASLVSHDLRNPLNVAQGRIDLIDEECDSEHIETVARAHDRMETLIDDLLALARAGETAVDTEPVALDATAERCWRTVSTGASTLATGTDGVVEADAGRLRQLLENLFRNAVEHGSTNPRSSSTHENAVEHGSTNPASQAHRGAVEHGGEGVTVTVGELEDDRGFYVEDDGTGIPKAERERVFEPGYSTDRDGTGLGLNIVREVADAHGWEVDVTEGNQGGARFEITGVTFVDQ